MLSVDIQNHLPPLSIKYINTLIDKKIRIELASHRHSKWGDFRAGRFFSSAIITINQSLEKEAFLLTLVHELAHYECWKKYKGRVQPHGKEWKIFFNTLTLPLLSIKGLFNTILKTAIQNHLKAPKSSICYDINLMRILSPKAKEQAIFLQDIPINGFFTLKNKPFKRLENKRTRSLCLALSTHKKYLIHNSAQVEITP